MTAVAIAVAMLFSSYCGARESVGKDEWVGGFDTEQQWIFVRVHFQNLKRSRNLVKMREVEEGASMTEWMLLRVKMTTAARGK